MAWHNRYISLSESAASTNKMRLSVEFRRHDLLWISPSPLTNPFTGKKFTLPVRIGNTVAIGSNILDMLLRETIQVGSDEEVTAEDGSLETVQTQVEKVIWRLRQPEELFATQQCNAAENHPLKKSLCTGGTVVGEQRDFVEVTKRSTVSINALVYRLAIGMTGSFTGATSYIGNLASEAWSRDLDRAFKLYNLIADAKDGILTDNQVPSDLRASASVAQTVETAVLRAACSWLGVDPETPLGRKRGRPCRSNEAGEALRAGQVIELTLQTNGTVIGRLVTNFDGLKEDTNLATPDASPRGSP